jgi:hypothetical protein
MSARRDSTRRLHMQRLASCRADLDLFALGPGAGQHGVALVGGFRSSRADEAA